MKTYTDKKHSKKYGYKKWIVPMGLVLLPLSALAGTNTDMFTTVFSGITDFITGTIGSTICGMALIATGFMWLKEGRIDKAQALTTAGGIALIYSASWFVSSVMGVG